MEVLARACGAHKIFHQQSFFLAEPEKKIADEKFYERRRREL